MTKLDLNEAAILISDEIKELHEFFEAWFTGSISINQFTRIEMVLNACFTLIPPSGEVMARKKLISSLKNSYGTKGDFNISTELIEVKLIKSDTYLAIYYELQHGSGIETKRISSAIFVYNQSCPNNFEWHSVHETWVS